MAGGTRGLFIARKGLCCLLENGAYETWESLESNKDRIAALKAEDVLEADATANRSQAQAEGMDCAGVVRGSKEGGEGR